MSLIDAPLPCEPCLELVAGKASLRWKSWACAGLGRCRNVFDAEAHVERDVEAVAEKMG